jgi:hypothetical protein
VNQPATRPGTTNGKTEAAPMNKLEKIIQSSKDPANNDPYTIHDDKDTKDGDKAVENHPLDRAQMYKNEGNG